MALSRVFVANRGEIALRIIRASHAAGLETVLAVSEADRDSLPARTATRAVCIGPAPAPRSYLDRKALVAAALGTGCDALHPGYGFLAESAELAALCRENGITFIGPTPEQIRAMGNKLQARALAKECGVPLLTGSEKVGSPEAAVEIARRIGLPVMIKAAAGGGGRGMKVITEFDQLAPMFTNASNEARAAFGDDTLYLERYIANARHVEVQVMGDRHGNVVHLGERDCSLQRRHQKIVEEAPSFGLPAALIDGIRAAAVKFARQLDYESAGTVEFIVDQDRGEFFFLEMNTRIQVEHPVTESITGVDLVGEQLRVAAGERLSEAAQKPKFKGHAIEVRITAEVPEQGFRPDPGLITAWKPPQGPDIRLDSHCYDGYMVPIYYDSLLGKLIVTAADRPAAVRRMREALKDFSVTGINTNLSFLRFIFGRDEMIEGRVNTRLVEELLKHLPS